MRVRVLTHAACAAALVLAGALGTSVQGHATPTPTMYVDVPTQEVRVTGVDCPQEDSCVIDYRDGAWYVREDADQ